MQNKLDNIIQELKELSGNSRLNIQELYLMIFSYLLMNEK